MEKQIEDGYVEIAKKLLASEWRQKLFSATIIEPTEIKELRNYANCIRDDKSKHVYMKEIDNLCVKILTIQANDEDIQKHIADIADKYKHIYDSMILEIEFS